MLLFSGQIFFHFSFFPLNLSGHQKVTFVNDPPGKKRNKLTITAFGSYYFKISRPSFPSTSYCVLFMGSTLDEEV